MKPMKILRAVGALLVAGLVGLSCLPAADALTGSRLLLMSKKSASGPVYNAQATAFFARLTTQPNAARKSRVNTFFASLNSAGVDTTKCDAMYLFAAHDQATALTNLLQASYAATISGTPVPVFSIDGGMAGNSGSFIDTSMNPSTAVAANYTQNNASILAYSVTPDGIAGESAGYGVGGTGYAEIYPHYTTNQMFTALNATIEGTVNSITDGSGLTAVDRSSAANFVTYKNGVAGATTTAASSALANNDITFLTQGAHYYLQGALTFGAVCGHLTAAQHLAIYNAVVAYDSGLASDYPTIRRIAGSRNDLPDTAFTVPVATANSFNVRVGHYLSQPCVNPSVVYVGFSYQAGNETNFANSITYHTQIESPSGTFIPLTKSGSANQVINPGDVFNESDRLSITIPAGQFWIRSYGTIASGAFFESDYAPNVNTGDLAQQGLGLSDASGGGAITTNMAFMPMAILICEVPTSQRTVAIMGDSISVGVGGFIQPVTSGQGGGIGYLAGYLDNAMTAGTKSIGGYVHFGRSSLAAATTVSYPNVINRVAFAAAANATDLWNELGVNDISSVVGSIATAATNLGGTNGNFLRSALSFQRVYQSTITPHTTISSSPCSDVNQTDAVAGNIPTLNTTIRAGTISRQTSFVEVANTAENIVVPNPNFWVAGYCNTDGLHPTQTAGNAFVAALTAANALSP